MHLTHSIRSILLRFIINKKRDYNQAMEIRTQDEYQKRQSKRTNQKIKILINRPDFQKDITFLRNKWKIPQEGIKTEKENEDWNDWILDETDSYYYEKWPIETKKMIELRKVKKYDEAEEIKRKINTSAPLNALNNDIWAIIIKYCLPVKWHSGIKNYLLSGDSDDLKFQTGLTVNFNWDHGILRPSIEFDEDTTLPDLKRVWSWARKLLKRKKNVKFQPLKNFERDKEVYQLKQANKGWKEIAEKISARYSKELDYNDINIIVKRYKERLHIN